jgi:hypothetical protein
MDEKGRGHQEDEGFEREVLALVLVEHPVRLTLQELQKALGRPEQVENAVEALIGAGLLSRDGEDVVPTPAAIRFNEIEPIDPPETV